MSSFVYVIDDGNGLSKIGVSNNPSQRIHQLQTGTGAALTLFGFIECKTKKAAHRVERLSHAELKLVREKREWFKTSAATALGVVRDVYERVSNEIECDMQDVLEDRIGQLPAPIPKHLIEACSCKQDAIRLCVRWSGIQDSSLIEILEVDKGNFSRMMSGAAQFPHNKENLLQDICGNEAILDWCNYSRGKKAIEIDNSEKIAALEKQIEKMRATG